MACKATAASSNQKHQRPRTGAVSYTGKEKVSAPRFICPHCKAYAVSVKSRLMGALMKETTYRCTNLACGHIFVCTVEVSRTLSPSGMPDPEVNIPFSQHIRQLHKPATP